MTSNCPGKIPGDVAKTLAGLFRERVRQTPDQAAYSQYDADTGQWNDSNWADMGTIVARWQAALASEDLQPGDRVAIMMRNCKEWVIFDQAALGCGLVVVPLYIDDRPDSSAYILNHSGSKLLFLQGQEHWEGLTTVLDRLSTVSRIITLEQVQVPDGETRVRSVAEWLPEQGGELHTDDGIPDSVATIVYTSGTTGRPKGVMLSHRNIIVNADSALDIVQMSPGDTLLSFLPLSHTFEQIGRAHV